MFIEEYFFSIVLIRFCKVVRDFSSLFSIFIFNKNVFIFNKKNYKLNTKLWYLVMLWLLKSQIDN